MTYLAASPRVLCPRCGQNVCVRRDDRLRMHRNPATYALGSFWCSGSRMVVELSEWRQG